MKFAIYGRKSIFKDTSDSIDNQFRMAKDWISLYYPDEIESLDHYSDEDFTGANTNRPDLQRLIDDIKSGLVDVLIVYQLDRLSRDVRDFSNMYALMEEHNVKFVSLRENIDTSTPIGKAMMYVSVVFAQMERENIANRVTDNMIGLAKKGLWTGGNPPYGYVRQPIIVNGRKHVTIVAEPEGIKYVMWIFDTFLNGAYTLNGLETHFRQQEIKTRKGGYFAAAQLFQILTTPFCAEATSEVYDYFQEKGCIMDPDSPREKWDGTKGVLVYGRTTEKNKKHQLQPPEKWLVCLGMHEPFMPAEKWLAAQNQFSKNKISKTMKYDIPLLKGSLRCSCGALMGVSRKKRVRGGVSSWYFCQRRMRQGKEYCNSIQTSIDILDNKILETFKEIEADPLSIRKFMREESAPLLTAEPKIINSKISTCESKIERLASSLALAENSTAAKYVLAEIEKLDLELSALKREYALAMSSRRQKGAAIKSAEDKAREIADLLKNISEFTPSEKNSIVRELLKECVWDGETLFITL